MPTKQKAQLPKTIYLADYQCTPFIIDNCDLLFELNENATRVSSTLSVRRRPGKKHQNEALVLNGQELELESIKLNKQILNKKHYKIKGDTLTINKVPASFTLEIVTLINPGANTSLSGLYVSSNNFCTQCEAEGFRKITYMYDRPDVMARYSTTIVAERKKYPVLLSNGNLVERGEGDIDGSAGSLDGKHWVKWEDPFPKPTYLFALVAGDLAFVEDHFVTCSGRDVTLQIYVQHHNADKCEHAMASLKNAMKWDEDVFGREYDLDIYMIVAVDDFNMGAMENKGLNVFNSKYVLAKPETATDFDYQGIEGVIGHEYFHNWSGNRVTCRDWFQLSLKEGFTVFRDQNFSADMTSKGVKRIHEVNILRTHQFKEDAGPMAHPIRPASYVEINNFYTVTVYNKGAEVVRMLQCLLGTAGFRKGTDLYFERHDGQAVTTDDFVKAMEDANHVDFSQFRLWYSQAGTPLLTIRRTFNAKLKTLTLDIEQSCPPTPGQKNKAPFHIPVTIGLLDAAGQDIRLKFKDTPNVPATTAVLQLRNHKERFTFTNLSAPPVVSVLRGFSAPVKVNIDLSNEELAYLMANDSDEFNRWDAGQQLAINLIKPMVADFHKNVPLKLDTKYLQAIKAVLLDEHLDDATKALAIHLPMESYVAEFFDVIDPIAIHSVLRFMRVEIAKSLQNELSDLYQQKNEPGPYKIDQISMGRRSLKNTCMHYLMELETAQVLELCEKQYRLSNNMTDQISALAALANAPGNEKNVALEEFYQKWKNDPLVVDKWLSIQAASRLPQTLENVKLLAMHEAFNIKNPNKVRALVGAFCGSNAVNFHAIDGEGYKFLTDFVLKIDVMNPQIASRLVSSFSQWRRYDKNRQKIMQAQLQKILKTKNLSKDVYEIVTKSLAN